MNVEYEIQNLKNQISDLQDTVRKLAKGNTEEVSKREQTTAQVDSLTPYTETKTAYIGDKSIYFLDVPNGNLTVYGLDTYKTTRTSYNAVLIEWETPLEEVTEITISIQ